jgi:hypothetical protein
MKKSLARMLVVTASLGSVLCVATSAGAATLTVEDSVGDTWTTDYSPDGTVTDLPAGSQVNVDIAKTVIKYASGKVTFKATYAELDMSTNRFQLGVRLRTNEGLKRVALVDTAVSQDWAGVHAFGKPNGDELKCAGLSHEIDYAADTVKLVVPGSCLSKPRWVQAYVGADGYATTSDQPTLTFTHDNGLDDSWKHGGWTGKVRKG